MFTQDLSVENTIGYTLFTQIITAVYEKFWQVKSLFWANVMKSTLI